MGHIRVGCHEVHGSPCAKVFKVAGWVILGILGAVALAVVFGLLIQWLWNAIMPDIFGLPEVTYWQAVGIVVLSHILFGGHSHNHKHHHSHKSKSRKRDDGAPICINKDGEERHWDSFREFWNEYGREAFDKWLNGRDSDNTTPDE